MTERRSRRDLSVFSACHADLSRPSLGGGGSLGEDGSLLLNSEGRIFSSARVVCVLLPWCPEFMKDRLRILTVEDEPAVTQLLALILGGPAAKVSNASDGWMALMKIGAAEEPFDVIITDHRMRRLNGLELVRRLRVRKFAGKIIVLSAYLTEENIRAYEELKVDMMLSKPFDVEELRLAMDLLTKKPSAPITAPMAAQV
jgi:CheY-like chemotaxis protein